MISFDLSPSDVELYTAARQLLLTAHHGENHRVAAAMRGASGAIYLGLHVGSKRINVCAESSALANARIAQEASIKSTVAVSMDERGEPQVTNPCGVCRELLRNYGAQTTVLVDAGGEVGTVNLEELLPYPWMRATETEWTTQPPEAMKTH
ncbi:cytidine deaminase [Arthrobacter methylotrophus]|uniref:CMP/dCMP-type deaminase domain-containing protein n=1 Tax=Arthrobacter methylotrophus TaxID=121291 RepID=A0ABV5UVV9_9MICC